MDNTNLRHALIKVAARNSFREAFVDELVKIDPEFEKFAWAWAKRKAGQAWSGMKRAGRWAKNNPWAVADGLLTASMFIPGVNVVGAGLRGASLAARGGMALYRANKLRKGLQAGKTLATGGAKLTQGYQKLRQAGMGAQQALKQVGGMKNALTTQGQIAKYTQQANRLKNQASTAFKGMNPLNRGGMGMGKVTPGNTWSAIGKGGPLWKGGRILKAGPQVGGKTRQALRLGGTAAGGKFMYDSATRDYKKNPLGTFGDAATFGGGPMTNRGGGSSYTGVIGAAGARR